VLIADAGDGCIVMANRQAAEMLHLPAELNLQESRLWEGCQRDGRPLTPAEWPLKRALATGETISGEEIVLKSRGAAARTVSVTAGPIRDAAGTVVAGVAAFQDVTGQRQQADLLARSHAELQQFAYAVSHDLQEPLRAIGSYAQLLNRTVTDLTPDAKEYLRFITEGSARMTSLIQDLLAYSRLDASADRWETTSLDAVLAWTRMNLHQAIQESRAVIVADELPVIQANQSQMILLFQNLLSNAIKYRRPDVPPEISISAGEEAAGWRFTVRDNGIGIDERYHQQVFGVFKRLHGREYPGTGIGLALCKRIVESHGGQIGLESTPGVGTSVYFTIPQPG
jgi:light-regulated signal transduction histidine kinase (bacteriophytochrome)